MTIDERRKCIRRLQASYLAADRAERGRLLSHLEELTDLDRKTLIRRLRSADLARRPRTRQRGREYGHEVDDALRVIWESLDYVCAERLTPALVPTARLLARHGELRLDDELAEQLGRISIASVQRRLSRLGQDTPRLPFPILELHPDNGPEFLNAHLVRFWGTEITGLTLSRSRPYRKNDNRCVEQKNDTLVRAYVGHGRLDTAEQCAALNARYDRMWAYYHLFQPVLHLIEKTASGTRVRRRWDDAKTPFERLAATDALSPERRARLAAPRDGTNPRALRREIHAGLDALLLRRPASPPARTPATEVAA